MPVIYAGRCSRCRQPYREEKELGDRINYYLDCSRCKATVALVRIDKQAGPSAPVLCADCQQPMQYHNKRRRWVCYPCNSKG